MTRESIHSILEDLPKSNMTTRLLGALDYIVPGEWKNVTSFEEMIKLVTGEEDQGLIQQVGERAIALYAESEQGYQRAVRIFRLVDDTSGLAGVATIARKIGDASDFLSFLSKITPKADTTQAIDAGVKLVAELAAFCSINGLPGDSIGDFAASLASYEKDDAMRLAAWIVCDGMIPLGPDFLARVVDTVSSATNEQLGQQSRFARLLGYLPGGSVDAKREIMKESLGASQTAIAGFIAKKGIERQGVLERISGHLGAAGGKLDGLAAAIDLATNYFEHTGVQSVARRVIARAYGEI
ncbi:hypothetical protein [Sorangium sp. So ce124]|uniref:hypothetical protein n=1 Tax=Sorangium sp. So ce124 TaxID=3133280 RepID=UPI003F63B915